MNLTDVQKQKVVEWIQQGLKLSEIQTRLDNELGVRMTYMEVKMLLADLSLKPKDQEPPKPPPSLGDAPGKPESRDMGVGDGSKLTTSPMEQDQTLEPEPEIPGGGGSVSVTMDAVTRPGALVSGKVTFSDKKTAEWYLDQYGRLGLAASEKGYKPSQMDLMAFQTELQNQLAKMGY